VPVTLHTIAIAATQSPFVLVVDQRVIVGLMVVLALLGSLLLVRLASRRRHQPAAAYRPEFIGTQDDRDPPEQSPRRNGAAQAQPATASTMGGRNRWSATDASGSADVEDMGLDETPRIRSFPTAEEIARTETTDPAKAALQWERIAFWIEATRAHTAAGNLDRATKIMVALEQGEQAVPLLRDALAASPSDERIRLRLIETLLDLSREREALDLLDGIATGGLKPPPSAHFLESIGRSLEALHMGEEAENWYRIALGRDDKLSEAQQRLLLLKQMRRLNQNGQLESDGARDLLNRLAFESSIAAFEAKRAEKSSGAHATLTGHEIIVGHLAMGFQKPEPAHSVRSIYSLSRRFRLESLMSETNRSATFKASDRLLDFTVALKLYRFADDFDGMDTLRERLNAVAHLNHPNLGKLTFVDREGPIVRVATEYLPGGNLRDFFQKLGGVGLPLIIRMAMHIASALHSAHLRGVPHGDVRPENMLIGPDQRIKLVDFVLSPLPVRVPPPQNDSADSEESTGSFRFANLALPTEGTDSDILQFADILEFMLQHCRRTAEPAAASGMQDTTNDMKELILRIRGGSFTSILRLWQVLHEIFERTLPSGSTPENLKH